MDQVATTLRKCTTCSAVIPEPELDCTACRAKVSTAEGTPVPLLVVCILMILGSVLAILRGMFYQRLAHVFFDTDFSRGWVILITGLGTLAGGVLMLRRRRIGLYVFTAFQLLYIATVISGFLSNSTRLEDAAEHLAGMLTVIFFITPALVLLLMSCWRRVRMSLL